jgi:DNA mismatch repair protein MSH3
MRTGSTGYAQQWTFVPQESLASPSGPPDHVKEARKAELHEAFKKKFLINESRSMNQASTSSTSDTPDIEESGIPVTEDMDTTAEGGNILGDEGDESDPGFRELMNVFSHPSSATTKVSRKQKASDKATPATGTRKQASAARKGTGSKKLPAKIGPSGKPYTPLELQVRAIH